MPTMQAVRTITRLVRPIITGRLPSAPRFVLTHHHNNPAPRPLCTGVFLHPRSYITSASLQVCKPANITRSFTTLSPLRPSLTPLRRPGPFTAVPSTAPTTATTDGTVADLVSQSAVSSHPALAGQGLRFGPRNTMNGHTRLVQKRRHGFLYRMRSRTGRKILLRRRIKGRKQLAQ